MGPIQVAQYQADQFYRFVSALVAGSSESEPPGSDDDEPGVAAISQQWQASNLVRATLCAEGQDLRKRIIALLGSADTLSPQRIRSQRESLEASLRACLAAWVGNVRQVVDALAEDQCDEFLRQAAPSAFTAFNIQNLYLGCSLKPGLIVQAPVGEFFVKSSASKWEATVSLNQEDEMVGLCEFPADGRSADNKLQLVLERVGAGSRRQSDVTVKAVIREPGGKELYHGTGRIQNGNVDVRFNEFPELEILGDGQVFPSRGAGLSVESLTHRRQLDTDDDQEVSESEPAEYRTHNVFYQRSVNVLFTLRLSRAESAPSA